jgi:peroxiredoxin (alkyl hydroperoxide reductase subunit C)
LRARVHASEGGNRELKGVVMEGSMPLLGDRFPEMTVRTTHGKLSLPGDMGGKWYILFSHPADFTPVCTTEFVAFQKRYGEFKALNCELIGLSIDQVFSHMKWIEWIHEKLDVEISFPLIADDMGEVAKSLGLVHPGKGTNTVRGVFIVDARGVLRASLSYPQELGRNTEEILRMVQGLQISDRNGAAIPANWPRNEIVGSDLMVPPALDEATARQRLQQYECLDWWFCHKKMGE